MLVEQTIYASINSFDEFQYYDNKMIEVVQLYTVRRHCSYEYGSLPSLPSWYKRVNSPAHSTSRSSIAIRKWLRVSRACSV